tara:strand:+ start:505 stop:702 length:198 start_codon:yes stop_codon:yes gene_type:complete
MKWKLPKLGDRRTRTWFAWFPVTINFERRWLEEVTVIQQYKEMCHISESGMPVPMPGWSNVEFGG